MRPRATAKCSSYHILSRETGARHGAYACAPTCAAAVIGELSTQQGVSQQASTDARLARGCLPGEYLCYLASLRVRVRCMASPSVPVSWAFASPHSRVVRVTKTPCVASVANGSARNALLLSLYSSSSEGLSRRYAGDVPRAPAVAQHADPAHRDAAPPRPPALNEQETHTSAFVIIIFISW